MEKQNNKSKAEERLGEIFVSNEGYEFVIIEYNKYSDVTVEFQDEYKARVHTTYGVCKSGEIKNPYHKSVYGIGCLGLNRDGSRPITKIDGKSTRESVIWHRMLERCYSGKYETYANVNICDRWLVYANFLEDLPKIEGYEIWRDNPNQHIALDKDIKQQDVENKAYSLETVKFITNSENVKEAMQRTKQKKVICIETKQVFECIKDADRWNGLKCGIGKCCRGKKKTAGGYHWQYYDEYKRQLRLNTDIKNSQLVA